MFGIDTDMFLCLFNIWIVLFRNTGEGIKIDFAGEALHILCGAESEYDQFCVRC